MQPFVTRRLALALPLLSACATEDSGPYIAPGAPSYGHLTPLRLKVSGIEITPPGAGAAMLVQPPAPVTPSELMVLMAQGRLSAAGGTARAKFLIQTASLSRESASSGGLFTPGSEKFRCVMSCRLEIISPENISLAFTSAEVRRDLTSSVRNDDERARAAERVVKLAGQDLNIEFEYQVRRNLRSWLQLTAAAGEAVPQPVEREALPRG